MKTYINLGLCLGSLALWGVVGCEPHAPEGAVPATREAQGSLGLPKGGGNQPPTAFAYSAQVPANTTVLLDLEGLDGDGDPITFELVSAPTRGDVTLTSGQNPRYVYTPDTGVSGVEQFQVRAYDGTDRSQAVNVTLYVGATNLPPEAQPLTSITTVNTSVALQLPGTDPENGALSFTVLSQPSNGTLTGTAPNLTYRPNTGYNGTDYFTFKANDGSLDSNTSTVTVLVGSVATIPTARNDNAATARNTPVGLTLRADDIDNSPLVYAVVSQPTRGTLNCTGQTCTYTPTTNLEGWDSFRFRASDGTTHSFPGTFSVFVRPANGSPTATPVTVSTARNTAVPVQLQATDPENNALSYTVVGNPSRGTLSGTAPNLLYTPNNNTEGVDVFYARASDGTSNSNVVPVVVLVGNSNRAPVAQSQEVRTLEDEGLAVVLTGVDPDGSPLTYTITTPPTRGTLSGTAPNLTYTPNNNYSGNDSFSFRVSDGSLNSGIATIRIFVEESNDAPVSQDSVHTLAEDAPLTANFSYTDSDGDAVTHLIIAQPLRGAVTVQGNAFTYTPTSNYNGTDSFSFLTQDGVTVSAPATVSLTITPVNDAPMALGDTITLQSPTSTGFTLRAMDVDSTNLTYTVLSQPQHGTLVGTAPNLSFVPTRGYVGNDSITFRASDGALNSNIATVSFTILPPAIPNDPPVAQNVTATVAEDGSVAVVLLGSDPNNNPISYEIVSQPMRGTFVGIAPNLTYSPNANATGVDTFAYRVTDGDLTSANATVTVTITPVNDAPAALSFGATVQLPTATPITLLATDIENDALTYTVLTQPTKGTLSGTAPNLTYTPNNGVSGTDTFTFRARDGALNSNTATVTITLLDAELVNRAPTATSRTLSVNEDTDLAVALQATDPDGDNLLYEIVTPPTRGTLAGQGANLTYRGNPNANGTDTFTFRASDGSLNSNNATVTITITPVNDAPVVQDNAASTRSPDPVAVTLAGSDPENDALTYTVLTQPTNGSLSGTAPNLTYTPNANYIGNDAFTFRARDGALNSNTATVTITVLSPLNTNRPPTAQNATATVAEDGNVAINFSGSDPDNDPLLYEIVSAPTRGVLSGQLPNARYFANPNATGTDTFTYRVTDGDLESPNATVTVTITPVNDAPTALTFGVAVQAPNAAAVTLVGSDIENDALTYTVLTQPTNGALSGTAPNLTYTPNPGFSGNDSFTYRVRDGQLDSAPATINLGVLAEIPVNRAPTAQGQALTVAEDTNLPLVLMGADPDGDALAYEIITPPTRGTLVGQAPNLTYRGDPDANGPDTFTFRTSDGDLTSAAATVTITITPAPDAPVAQDNSATTRSPEPVSLTLSATDAEGDALTYTVLAQPTNGTLSGTAPNLTYTPNANYAGTDTFTFRARDGALNSNTATVTITVLPPLVVNRAPTAQNVTANVQEDGNVALTLVGSDPDGDRLTYEVVAPPQRGVLTGQAPSLRYFASPNAAGTDTFTYRVTDGTLSSPNATITVTIAPVNDAPLAYGFAVRAQAPQGTPIELLGADADGDALTYEVSPQPQHGTLTGTAPNLIYTPTRGYAGPDSFGYRARDGQASSETATVDILVLEEEVPNQPPVGQPQSLSVDENVPRNFVLTASDPDGDPLVLALVTAPTKGTITGVVPNLTYTPTEDANGPDSFVYQVTDGELFSERVTVTVTITAANSAPVALAQTVYTAEGEAKPFTLIGADPEDDALTYTVLTQPQHGTLSGTAPNLTYTPAPRYFGEDSFTFRVRDGSLNSAPATVTLVVVDDNGAPVAQGQTLTTREDQPLAITLTANDPDEEPLFYFIMDLPRRGTITGTPPNVTYTPRPGFAGTDSFTFAADDGTVSSSAATVTITVTPLDRNPPTLSVVTEAGWYEEPVVVVADVADDRCSLRPGVVAFPAEVGVEVFPGELRDWQAFTEPLEDGVWPLNLTVVSPCSAKRGVDNVVVGVDGQAPVADILFVSQTGVDPQDPDSWAGVEDFGALPLPRVRLSDTLSGLARVEAKLVQVDADEEVPLLDQDFDLDAQALPLPVGPETALLDLCQSADVCRQGRLSSSLLSGERFYFEVTTTDQLGNVGVARSYFQYLDLASALNLWRRKLGQRNSALPGAEALLTQAEQRLAQGPALLQAGQLGSLLLLLEDVAALERRAVALDEALSPVSVGARVVPLALGVLDARWETISAQNDDAYLAELVAALRQAVLDTPLDDVGSLADAFLTMAQLWFHMDLVGQPRVDVDFVSARELVQTIQSQRSALINLQDRLGYTDPNLLAGLSGFGEQLQRLNDHLAAVETSGPASVDAGEHLNHLLLLDGMIRELKGLEEAPLWVRSWQWALSVAGVPTLRHFQQTAESQGTISGRITLHGRGYAQDSAEYREAVLVEDAFDVFGRQVCLSNIYFNLASPQPSPLAASCCEEARAVHAVDGTYAIPAECR